ncbi:hypothetical protein CEXT_466741 [Caerostris extrusa]|uniref:Uncharacterized protein n=1 Tax=Caerostris extrusa TaxID=172846 RepID=A0AAV4WSI8_CAEEX|nr:hypothetical protein CEXT_466741 [Caerostris extrusa]
MITRLFPVLGANPHPRMVMKIPEDFPKMKRGLTFRNELLIGPFFHCSKFAILFVLVALVVCAVAQHPYYGGYYNGYNGYVAAHPYAYNYYGAYNPYVLLVEEIDKFL